MAERPILFTAPMVRAILDGRKTQTRRAVKPQPAPHESWDWSWPVQRSGVTPGTRICWRDEVRTPNLYPYCPYGVPGDLLWVKETWRMPAAFDGDSPANAKGRVRADLSPNVFYEADGFVRRAGAATGEPGKTRVSIHMPRWASRITLRITDVRVERLQDISLADVRAEGLYLTPRGWAIIRDQDEAFESARDAYQELWQQINGPGSWSANPWVWAVSFERVPA